MQTRSIATRFQKARRSQSEKLMESQEGTLDQRLIKYMFRLNRNYIKLDEVPSIYKLPYSERSRLELTKDMVKFESSDRRLFHLTVTYKPYRDRNYQETDVNNFFTNFYRKGLLPYLLKTEEINRPELLEYHPITYCFVDEHEHSRVGNGFPVRLHHHAVLAVHPSTILPMVQLHGTNTLRWLTMSEKIATSQVTDARPPVVLYASKKMKYYPDYMHFGPEDFDPPTPDFVPNPVWDHFQSAAVPRHRYRNY